jgi:hypothetical protein
MEAALCNAAADATDVTGSQSVQDGSRIKHNRYAFRELAPCAAIRPDLQARSAHSNCIPIAIPGAVFAGSISTLMTRM